MIKLSSINELLQKSQNNVNVGMQSCGNKMHVHF